MKKFFKKSKLNTGFTLIEGIIATAIFIVLIITSVNLYMIYSRSQRIASQRQKILSEAGFLMEQIAKDIRTREIAYEGIFRYDGSTPTNIYSTDYDDGISGYERELALREIDTHNPSIYYYFYDGLLGLSPTPLCVPDDTEKQKGLYKFSQIQIGDTIYCQKLLALEKVTVESAGFFISPSSDPFTNLDVNNQPRVTFYLKIADTLSPGAGKNVISFQTTVSQRVYKR